MAVLKRTCIGCRQVRARAELVRIVRSSVDGTVIADPRGKEKGRGAYVCSNIDCINNAMEQHRLNKAFRIAPGPVDGVSLESIDRLKQDLLGLVSAEDYRL